MLDLLLSIFLTYGASMNIILTGASSPIGKILLNYYCKTHTVYPVSRSHGWDLTEFSKQQELIELTKEADIFLNVAHIGYLQGVLLEQSQAKTNISFGSLITKFSWKYMKDLNTAKYISEKLFLEYVHRHTSNSALINISSYNSKIPSVTDEQIINATDDVILGRAILPKTYEISNGLGDLSLKIF